MYDPQDYLNLPSYEERLKLINLHTLKSRRELLIASFIYDVLHSNINTREISEAVVFNNNGRTRHARFLVENFHNTDYGTNEPLTRGCRIFNDYIDCYKETDLPSKYKYKNNLKKRLA